MKWYLYIAECSDKTLYTGITTDIAKRLRKHNSKKGSKSLLGKLPVKLVYNETFDNRSRASKREAEIKKFDRNIKLEIIRAASSTGRASPS